MTPLRADASWFAAVADRSSADELQAFYEANPEYWHITHGHRPEPGEAADGFDFRPPADMAYRDQLTWLLRDRATERVIGIVSVVTDLLAPGVIHLSFFMVETARHGGDLASEVYAAYEAWAVKQGARWLRLGVVAANRRGEAFWRRQGYVEVKRREGFALGARTHQLIVMVKPIPPNTLAEFLEAVPRDRPDQVSASPP
ncbi:MAG TPA: GNAT family N-acetyltransferase [Burkholderiaceae bacterium]|nr:GNAT family N-acetyltransferase [Burkholderiaceae bacterium]